MEQNPLTAREKKKLKKIRVEELMTVYKGLLTDKENKILSLFVQEEMTGARIARMLNVSRQAIHDHMRRALARMENCEKKMHRVDNNKKTLAYINKLQRTLKRMIKKAPTEKTVEKALKLLEAIQKNI